MSTDDSTPLGLEAVRERLAELCVRGGSAREIASTLTSEELSSLRECLQRGAYLEYALDYAVRPFTYDPERSTARTESHKRATSAARWLLAIPRVIAEPGRLQSTA